jgi:hypothetical protein
VSYSLRAGVASAAVVVCVLAICCASARAQPLEPQGGLLSQAQHVAERLQYIHDEESDAATEDLYCDGVLLWKRLQSEGLNHVNIFEADALLRVMNYLDDELGEDEFIADVVYDDWVECPPPPLDFLFGRSAGDNFQGAYVGWSVLWDRGTSRVTERFADSGTFSDAFRNSSGSPGTGIRIGYNFAPTPGGFVVGMFIDANALSENIYQTFPAGGYLGTTVNFDGTAGVKAGFIVAPSFLPKPVWVYGIGGVSVMGETLKLYLGGPVSSSNQIVPGATMGFGIELQPVTDAPVTIRAEYRHTIWEDAKFNMPSTSPTFNYTYTTWSDAYSLGIDYHFR